MWKITLSGMCWAPSWPSYSMAARNHVKHLRRTLKERERRQKASTPSNNNFMLKTVLEQMTESVWYKVNFFYWGNIDTNTEDMEQLNSMMTKCFFACYAPSCSMKRMTHRIPRELIWKRGNVSVLQVKRKQIIFAKTSQILCSVDNCCEHWYCHLKQVV